MRQVAGGHVCIERRKVADQVAAHMRGHPLAAVQQFHAGPGDAGIQALAYQRVGDAVVVAVNLNVVIHMHAYRLEGGHLVALQWQA